VKGCACAGDATNSNLGSVRGITMRDITMDEPSVGLFGGRNFIRGFSEYRQISNVRIERLKINGTYMLSAEAMGLEVGPFASNVTFVV
jgi:hypothetical protein